MNPQRIKTTPDFQPPGRVMTLCWTLAGAGALTVLVGLRLAPQRTWTNFLADSFYFVSLALAAAVFVAILHVSNAGWGIVVRRIPEAMMEYLPFGGATMLALYFGARFLYPWTDAGNAAKGEILQHRAPYMNVPFFFLRVALCFVLWIWLCRLLRRASLEQDRDEGVDQKRKSVIYAAAFLPIFAVTYSLASFDWIMSLEKFWSSTIFAVYNFSGLFLSGIAAITVLVLVLKRWGYLPEVNENHLHTLGKLMFAFSTFWAYIWISQYLLIYYANIPEETIFYLKRTSTPGWNFLFYLNLLLNWIIPFLLLMPREFKRRERPLLITALILIFGHWVDVYTLVAPTNQSSVTIGLYEVLIFLGLAAIFFGIVVASLRRAPLVPRRDPYLEESLHLHV